MGKTKKELSNKKEIDGSCKRCKRIKELEKDLRRCFESCRLREESLFTEVERRKKAEAKVEGWRNWRLHQLNIPY